jgi:S1-C subfamily serine protease
MADHFLTKTRVDLGRTIEVAGVRALEQYESLRVQLAAKAGPEAARLFAEPLISKGNDQAASTISWYTDRTGQGVPLSRLDPEAQAAVSAQLAEALGRVGAVLDDPEIGGLAAAALYIGGSGDIWAVDGKPVLVNWGLMPEAGSDLAARRAHYAVTLGPHFAMEMPPPLSESEQERRRGERLAGVATAATVPQADLPPTAASRAAAATGAAAGRGAGAPVGAAAAGAAAGVVGAGAGGAGAAEPPQDTAAAPRGRVPVVAWLPLLLLLLLFGGVLAWLLVPGNRIFAADGPEPAITDTDALLAAREINRALEQRLADLDRALDGAVCRADGTLLMPDGLTVEGLLPPELDAGRASGGQIVEGAAAPALPPAPERVVLSPEGLGMSDTATLLAHIDARTAMVLAGNGQGVGAGTGFFVGPDLLVTNFHVIEGAAPETIYVTNKALGGLKQAEVLKVYGPMREVGADFALLRIAGVDQPFYTIRQSEASMRLQSVITAGYPGDVLNTDAAFQALRRGDATAVPELTVTDGTVNAEQALSATTNAVVHSAPISRGNSGGPLIDMCGRVVGVNTFVVQGPLRNLNFALATDDLLAFLADTPAQPVVTGEACTPLVARPTSVPEAAGQ